jgi:hypothetical protein
LIGFDLLNRIIELNTAEEIIPPHCGNGTNDGTNGCQTSAGTPKSHSRNDGADRVEWKGMHEEILAKMEANMNAWREEMKTDREARKPTVLEANPEEIPSKAEHQEVPKEHAAVKPVGGMRKRRRGRNLAAERRQKPKEWTRVNCGIRRKLATACMKMTHCAKVARCNKGNVVGKNRTRDSVVRGTLKRRKFGRRRELETERKYSIRNRRLKQ